MMKRILYVNIIMLIMSILVIGRQAIKVNHIETLNEVLLCKIDSINNKDKLKFKFENIFATVNPRDGYDVKIDSDFVAEITLSGYNSIKNYPIVIIADSIYNNQLISNIDTFYTDEYSTVISKKFITAGKKTFYGKYVSYTLEGDLFSLVFPVEVIVE